MVGLIILSHIKIIGKIILHLRLSHVIFIKLQYHPNGTETDIKPIYLIVVLGVYSHTNLFICLLMMMTMTVTLFCSVQLSGNFNCVFTHNVTAHTYIKKHTIKPPNHIYFFHIQSNLYYIYIHLGFILHIFLKLEYKRKKGSVV